MARRRRGKKRNHFIGEPHGLYPGDDVGNRKSKQMRSLPPDDIGNRKDESDARALPPDDVGNRVDANPAHVNSGLLDDLDPRKGVRKKKFKTGGPLVRVGRYFQGGVNPVVCGDQFRAQKAQEAHIEQRRVSRENDGDAERGKKRRDGGATYEQVDGTAAQAVNERRAQRFFDFVEDDRFDYRLKSDPNEKVTTAQKVVDSVLKGAGRDAKVLARLLEDGTRPKVLVSIDEKGPLKTLDEARKPAAAAEPLFVLGNAALMSLNYLVNKIVNRYPSDRIRLAILPKSDEETYVSTLEEHRKQNPDKKAEKLEAKPKAKARPKADEAPAPEAEAAPELERAADAEPEVEAEEAAAKPKKKRATKVASTKKKSEVEAAPEEASELEGAEAAPPAKKAAAKKATTKKASTAKATAKKATTKKATAKKATTKKAATKKATTKKATTKKAAE